MSGYVDVLWTERRGLPAARFRLSESPEVPRDSAKLGNAPRDIGDVSKNYALKPPDWNTFVVPLDRDLAAAFVMVSMLQQAVRDRLHVAVAWEVPDEGQAFSGEPVVTDLRLLGPGGEFVPDWELE